MVHNLPVREELFFGGEGSGVLAMEVMVLDASLQDTVHPNSSSFSSSLPSPLSQTRGPFTRCWSLILPPSLGPDGAWPSAQ